MQLPLIINGNEVFHKSFTCQSVFYPGYSYQVADASLLDIANAIGNARKAEKKTIVERVCYLKKAATEFIYDNETVEHTVKMTGMPISLIAGFLADIANILRQTPDAIENRFSKQLPQNLWIQDLGDKNQRLRYVEEGFCYVVAPGNDPRVTALVASNLCYMGIPFIIKASKEDAAASLIIKALIRAGFDPKFCNLLYFNSQDSSASEKHFKILQSSSLVWVYGSDETVDKVLRYEKTGERYLLKLDNLGFTNDLVQLAEKLKRVPSNLLGSLIEVQPEFIDHFLNKKVNRHGSGNCATIFNGEFNLDTGDFLYNSIAYAIGCNSTKTAIIINNKKDWARSANDYLSALKVGDPLDTETKVGYTNPQNLDVMKHLVKKNQSVIKTYGFKILSDIQATPLIVETQNKVPDFFSQEISAYILAVTNCNTLDEAVNTLNEYSRNIPRLVVSFYNQTLEGVLPYAQKLFAHTVYINLPTNNVVLYYHEGNDYPIRNSSEKLICEIALK